MSREFGIPDAIRSDNGFPFASPTALFGLSKLSLWWLRFGIQIERIKPGNPQQNGRHERMHLMLKNEATQPPEFNALQQQRRFDDFMDEYNHRRPYQGIAMKYTVSCKHRHARSIENRRIRSTPSTIERPASPTVSDSASESGKST